MAGEQGVAGGGDVLMGACYHLTGDRGGATSFGNHALAFKDQNTALHA